MATITMPVPGVHVRPPSITSPDARGSCAQDFLSKAVQIIIRLAEKKHFANTLKAVFEAGLSHGSAKFQKEHMGDTNQRLFLERAALDVEGPVLEIGSKDYGSTEDFRALFPASAFIGIDLASGKGVDHVVDLTLPPPQDVLPLASFGLVICCSVLEHVKRPWVMAEHMSSLVRKGGYVFISVPWVWRYHAYPDDYFRFSPNGVKELFPEITFLDMAYSTTVTDEFLDLEDGISGVDDAMAQYQRDEKGQRKFLPYLMVNMVGRKI